MKCKARLAILRISDMAPLRSFKPIYPKFPGWHFKAFSHDISECFGKVSQAIKAVVAIFEEGF